MYCITNFSFLWKFDNLLFKSNLILINIHGLYIYDVLMFIVILMIYSMIECILDA